MLSSSTLFVKDLPPPSPVFGNEITVNNLSNSQEQETVYLPIEKDGGGTVEIIRKDRPDLFNYVSYFWYYSTYALNRLWDLSTKHDYYHISYYVRRLPPFYKELDFSGLHSTQDINICFYNFWILFFSDEAISKSGKYSIGEILYRLHKSAYVPTWDIVKDRTYWDGFYADLRSTMLPGQTDAQVRTLISSLSPPNAVKNTWTSLIPQIGMFVLSVMTASAVTNILPDNDITDPIKDVVQNTVDKLTDVETYTDIATDVLKDTVDDKLNDVRHDVIGEITKLEDRTGLNLSTLDGFVNDFGRELIHAVDKSLTVLSDSIADKINKALTDTSDMLSVPASSYRRAVEETNAKTGQGFALSLYTLLFRRKTL
jgi:hypothetical protein